MEFGNNPIGIHVPMLNSKSVRDPTKPWVFASACLAFLFSFCGYLPCVSQIRKIIALTTSLALPLLIIAEFTAMFSGENHSLTPALVDTLPGPLHEAIITSYNDGLVPIFTVLVPFALVGAAILFFTREEKLKETVE